MTIDGQLIAHHMKARRINLEIAGDHKLTATFLL